MSSRSVSSGFYVLVTGSIEGCEMSGHDNLYVKYSLARGADWSVLAGVEQGVSQIAQRTHAQSDGSSGGSFTWSYPIDALFRSTNVHGWPQLVLGVYGLTVWGGDVVRGYGCTHIPTQPGTHTRYIPLYTPVSSSLCQRLTAWLTNNPPEFFDARFIAQGKGREVTRVKSNGVVKVVFHVTTKNMREWGYNVGAERGMLSSTVQAQSGGGEMESSSMMDMQRGAGGGSGMISRPSSLLPPKTQLSATTTAGLQRQRSNLAATGGVSGGIGMGMGMGGGISSTLSPPSGRASPEVSASGGVGADFDEPESKYPAAFGSILTQRPTAAPSASSSLPPVRAPGRNRGFMPQ